MADLPTGDFGNKLIADVFNAKNHPKPDRPKLHNLLPMTSADVCNIHAGIVSNLLDRIELNNDDGTGYINAETFVSILDSDHPTIVAELKKLFFIGKMCLESDDFRIEAAQEKINKIKQGNADRANANAGLELEYQEDLAHHQEWVQHKYNRLFEWWDNTYLPFIAGRWKASPNMGIWRVAFSAALKANQGFGIDLPKGWWSKKTQDFEFLYSKHFAHMQDELVSFIKDVVTQTQNEQTKHVNKFVDTEYYRVLKTPYFRNAIEELEEDFNWQKRRYNDYYDAYDSYRQYVSSSNTHRYDYDRWKEKESQLIEIRARIRDRAMEQARAVVWKRHEAGEYGFEIMPWSPEEKVVRVPKSVTTNWTSSSSSTKITQDELNHWVSSKNYR